jgi:hypothetical protein
LLSFIKRRSLTGWRFLISSLGNGKFPYPDDLLSCKFLFVRKLPPSVSLWLLLVSGLHADLIHRYSFDGTALDAVVDSIGGVKAVLHSGAELDAKGALVLDGINDWAELPVSLLDGLQNVTIEAWMEWAGPVTSSWQTLFSVSKDNSSYFSFSPRAGTSPKKSRLAVARSGPEKKVNSQQEFPVGISVHLVTVFDVTNQQLRLYLDGQLQGTTACSYSLESLGVQNFWLGRPLYAQFPYFKGRYLEFRVYDDAFSDDQVARSRRFGPDELPGPSITNFMASNNPVRSGSKVNLNWEASANAMVTINPSEAGELAASGMLEVPIAQTTEFTLKAINADGTRTAKLIVEVDDRPIINDFTATPRVVVPGDPVVLSWNVAYATSISINHDVPGISGAAGSIEVRPDASLNYIITASNSSGNRTARVSVSVPGRLDVIINEVHYDSNPKTEKTEFLELYNNRTIELDLSGWHFSDGITYSFPDGTGLSSGAYFVLAEDATAFESKYGQKPDGTYMGSLSNNGESLVLRDAAGGRMDEISYNIGFPWPTSPSGEGPSMQLVNPQLDNDLGGSWRPAMPTPGARNSIHSEAPPPRVRQVRHIPEQPATGQPVTIKAKVTSVEEIMEVSLDYQVVAPGDYITIGDSRYATSWSTLSMRDDGQLGDVDAGDSTYTVVLPATVSTHRRLVRYRITAKDAKGATVTTPMADDPQPNFAFFCYDGVPSWQGSARPGHTSVATYSKELLESLPIYHLITTRQAHMDSQYIPDPGSGKYGGSDYKWKGTLVYGNKVYDHIHFRARGGVWRYAMGKNMWKFDFNRGHEFQPRDDYGKKYSAKWDKLNFSSIIQQGNFRHRGENGMFESVGFRLFNLAGVEGPDTHFVHFRIIESAFEAGATQYSTDFQGPYLAIEQLDGDFLDAHDLPDGNLYKMERGTGLNGIGGASNNQGRDTVTDYSDLVAFKGTYEGTAPSEIWWRNNFNLPSYFSYRSIVEGIHHGDIGSGKNYFYYRNPVTQLWQTIPWDLDLTWANNMYGNGNEPFKSRVANSSTFNHEYQNRLREIRDLLYNPEQTGALIDEVASFIYKSGESDFADTNQAMWDYNPILASSYVNGGKAGHGRFYESASTRDFAGMLQLMKDYVVSRGNWIDSNILTDNQIPQTPTATYTGPVGHPADSLTFRTSAFSDPQGSQTFGALRWRIAEIKHPGIDGYESIKRGKYEITPSWEQEQDTFSNEISIPANSVEPGRRYRVRVRHRDTSNRWSHWSSPFEIVPGSPIRLADLKKYLAITEIHSEPSGATAAETAAGFKTSNFEFLELYNFHPSATLNLSGLKFDDGIDFVFDGDVKLSSGARVLLVANRAAFESRNGKELPVVGEYSGKLNNGGEKLLLVVPSGVSIHEFEFPKSQMEGRSIVLIDPLDQPDYANPANWGTGGDLEGSPGGADTVDKDGDSDGLPDNWELQYFGDLGQAHENDFDGDGLKNFLEYAMGSNPIDPNSINLPQVTVGDDGYFNLTFIRLVDASGLTYAVEYSEDLKIWQTSDDRITSVTEIIGERMTVIARDNIPPKSARPLFYRISVSAP